MSAGRPAPVLDERLARALAPWLDRPGPVLLAVSGGPDSTALMHVAARCGPPARLRVATVDHGLRPEAAEEARAVASLAARLGLPHRTLVWNRPHRGSGLQAAARDARYRLLAAHAAAIGAGLVLTGHTADDQAETVLMRLIAGSGPAGLAGMRPERPLAPGIVLARPFLGLPKVDLVAHCEAHGLSVLHDPSNADDRFARARLRSLRPRLSEEGLTSERLCRLARRAARDDAALAHAASKALAAGRRPSESGRTILDGASLATLPQAVAVRVVGMALDGAEAQAGEGLPHRLERLESLVLDALLPALAEGRAVRRTLRGWLIEATRSGEIRIGRAPPRRAGRPASARGGSLAAGVPDLLGKGEGAAYIADEGMEQVSLSRDAARMPPRIDR